MAIRQVQGQFLAISRQQSIPGIYDTERAARYAFRFPNEALQQLQDEVNEKEPDPNKRVITFEMLQALRKRLNLSLTSSKRP